MRKNFKVRKEGEWFYIFQGKEKVTTKSGNPLIGINEAIMSCAADELAYPDDMMTWLPCNMVCFLQRFADVYAANGMEALRAKIREEWRKPPIAIYPHIEHSSMLMTKAIKYLRNSLHTLVDDMDDYQLVAIDLMRDWYPIDLIQDVITDYLPIHENGELELKFTASYCHGIGESAIKHKMITMDKRAEWELKLACSLDMFSFFFNHAGHLHQDSVYIKA